MELFVFTAVCNLEQLIDIHLLDKFPDVLTSILFNSLCILTVFGGLVKMYKFLSLCLGLRKYRML